MAKNANPFRDVLKSSGQARPRKAQPIAAAEPPAGNKLKTGYIQVGANIPKTLKIAVFQRLQEENVAERNFSELVTRLLQEWLGE